MTGKMKGLLDAFEVFENVCPGSSLLHLKVFLQVSENDGKITMPELMDLCGMSQSNVSRTVKDLSIYMADNPESLGNRIERGAGVLETRPDAYERRRLAVYLTEKGRELKSDIAKVLGGE